MEQEREKESQISLVDDVWMWVGTFVQAYYFVTFIFLSVLINLKVLGLLSATVMLLTPVQCDCTTFHPVP
jgi:hypothetical protein